MTDKRDWLVTLLFILFLLVVLYTISNGIYTKGYLDGLRYSSQTEAR